MRSKCELLLAPSLPPMCPMAGKSPFSRHNSSHSPCFVRKRGTRAATRSWSMLPTHNMPAILVRHIPEGEVILLAPPLPWAPPGPHYSTLSDRVRSEGKDQARGAHFGGFGKVSPERANGMNHVSEYVLFEVYARIACFALFLPRHRTTTATIMGPSDWGGFLLISPKSQ